MHNFRVAWYDRHKTTIFVSSIKVVSFSFHRICFWKDEQVFILLFYYKVDKVDTGHVIRGIPPGFSGYDEPGFRIHVRHLPYGSWTTDT